MDLVLVNGNAAGVSCCPGIDKEIKRFAPREVQVELTEDKKTVHAMLDAIASFATIRRIYLVGGDGTFYCALQWVMRQPKNCRPMLVCVGGGKFCYMRVAQGMPYRDPLRNLKLIFANDQAVIPRPWRPVMVCATPGGGEWYGALVGNGLIARYIDWYDKHGKGNSLTALYIIMKGVYSALLGRQDHPLLHYTHGTVKVDDERVVSGSYAGLAVSTVGRFSLGFAPFRFRSTGRQVNIIAYWGTLRRLAAALPWLFFGRVVWFVRSAMHNQPAKAVTLITSDCEFVFDGELENLGSAGQQAGASTLKSFEISSGPEIIIGHFVR